jgi:hypothetical protein
MSESLIDNQIVSIEVEVNPSYPWSKKFLDFLGNHKHNEFNQKEIINHVNISIINAISELKTQWEGRSVLDIYDSVDADLDLELFESILMHLSLLKHFKTDIDLSILNDLEILKKSFSTLLPYYQKLSDEEIISPDRRLSGRLQWLSTQINLYK